MELSKETYTESPHKESDVQSVIKSIMEDTNIVSNNVSIQSQQDNPPEKKKRGRPPKNKDNTETLSSIVKKPRGRPRKQTPTPTPQKKLEPELEPELELELEPELEQTPQQEQSIEHDTIIPLIQSISSQHSLHHIPDKTLKYVIFLIHLFHHTQPPPPTSPTLTALIHHTITHFNPHHLHTSAPHIKHSILHNTTTPPPTPPTPPTPPPHPHFIYSNHK